MAEITLRLLSSALGYVSLVLMLRSPEPIRMFALYLPSSILLTLALDLGRGETALRQGLSDAAKRRVLTEMLMLTGVSIILLALLPFGSFHDRTKALVGLVLSGALQAYVDVILRLCLFDHRRSLYLYSYFVALNCLNVAAASSIAFGLITPDWGLGVCVLLPTMAVAIFARLLRRLPRTEHPRSDVPGSPRVLIAAVLYRVFPPAVYTAYATALTRFTPELATSARALYFVFGFIHTRRMTREGARKEVFGTSALMLLLTSVLSVPLLLAAAQPPRITWLSLGLCVLITCCASALFSWFLSRYTAFLNEPEQRMDALDVAAPGAG